ncbi:MAG: FkbM family methyltransferase [Rhizomicrobium sp.]
MAGRLSLLIYKGLMMSGLAIARAINDFLGSVAGVKIVRAKPAEAELARRLRATRGSVGGLSELRDLVAAKLTEQASARVDGHGEEIWSVPARLNGDWYWLPADVMPYLAHCQTGELGDADIVRSLEIETWNYFQIRDAIKPGWTVLDIGANMGIFSIMLSRGVGTSGRVFSFEPNPEVHPQLKAMLQANGAGNVEIVPFAVADKPGELDFLRIAMSNVRREASSLKVQETSEQLGSESHEIIRVPVTTVDTFVKDRGIVPNMMKIDVEGADLEAIIGAEQTIRTHHPVIQLELHAFVADAEPKIFEFLTANNYKITRLNNQLLCV